MKVLGIREQGPPGFKNSNKFYLIQKDDKNLNYLIDDMNLDSHTHTGNKYKNESRVILMKPGGGGGCRGGML